MFFVVLVWCCVVNGRRFCVTRREEIEGGHGQLPVLSVAAGPLSSREVDLRGLNCPGRDKRGHGEGYVELM